MITFDGTTITYDGFELTPKVVELLKVWAPENETDASRLQLLVKTLSKIQDYLTRQLESFDDDELVQITNYLCGLISVKDDLTEFVTALSQKGGTK